MSLTPRNQQDSSNELEAVSDRAGSTPQEQVAGTRMLSATKVRAVRIMAIIVVPGLFVAFLMLGLTRPAPVERVVGKEAPEFSLPLLSGGTLSSADLKGRPIVVNFWASWCVPCRKEAPLLQAMYEKYRGRGVQFLGVVVQDSAQGAGEFVKEFGITFPSVRDPDLQLVNSFGVRGLPETFFIDQNYVFRGIASGTESKTQSGFKILGAIDADLLESQIRYLLEVRAGQAK